MAPSDGGHRPKRTTWLGRLWWALPVLALAAAAWFGPPGRMHRFADLTGPAGSSVLPAEVPARWQDFDQGETSRLAIFLTDPDSAWLGVAHGLKSIGVPFRITRDVAQATRHRMVLVYPSISGKLPSSTLQALANHARQGGTLVAGHVVGGGLGDVFGFADAVAGEHAEVHFDTGHTVTAGFTDPAEQRIRIGNPAVAETLVGSYSYTRPRNAPLATFEDGSAAITVRRYEPGTAYALGMDLGHLLHKGYNNRQEGIARSYVNGFEPTLDVLLRLIKAIYLEAEPAAVTLGTVPQGKSLSVLITHDIDYTRSMVNAVTYAKSAQAAGVPSTHFIQTKYMRDWNDDIFFDDQGVARLKELYGLGREIGSHTVSHSKVMETFPQGTGDERYPTYQPFITAQTQAEGATLLGELRVSRFLLEHHAPGAEVVSFRPGHLRNPYSLPQSLQATGFRYSSSVTANTSLTHLPFRLTHGRGQTSPTSVFEFPVTVEDEFPPRLGDRLPQAVALARQIARYGGTYVALIHTDVLDHKLAFQEGLIEAVRPFAWFGSMRSFGDWWVARDAVALDVTRGAEGTLQVSLRAPVAIEGLTLAVPATHRLGGTQPTGTSVDATPGQLVIGRFDGTLRLTLRPR